MEGNKFATMLQRNTNKVTVSLVYAVLEWTLITLLLLNSLLSYLITKFANFFGLKPPCPWCSRFDHVFEQEKSTHSYRDLLCEDHAAEISKLDYCLNHGKLAEMQTMCENCFATRPHHYDKSIGITHSLASISWLSTNSNNYKVENVLRCSCCNGSLNNKLYPPYLLLKPSWDAANYVQKVDLIVEKIEEEKDGSDNEHDPEKNNGDHDDEGLADEHQILSDIESFLLREAAEDRSSSVSNMQCDEKDDEDDILIVNEKDPNSDDVVVCHSSDIMTNLQGWLEEDTSLQVIKLHSGIRATCDTSRVIPVDLIDRFTLVSPESCISEKDLRKETGRTGSSDSAKLSKGKLQGFEISINGVDSSSFLNFEKEQQESVFEACEHSLITERVQNLLDEDNKKHSDDQLQIQVHACAASDIQEDQCSSSDDDAEISAFDKFMSQNNLLAGTNDNQSDTVPKLKSQVEKRHEEVNHKLYEAEVHETEDKAPDTPGSVDGLPYLHKKLMLYKKRESEGEESPEGSVASEMDGGDPGLTIERLKAALIAERKAFSALYQELEEERSASAIAANQTMAMITRLQEEKASMKMEASQYQRMMEEQSEYDQEALQLLNELMAKREREKGELEKELEKYRQKAVEYETIENIRALRRMKNGGAGSSRHSSASCSDDGDSDELSVDLNREATHKDSENYMHQENNQNIASINTTLNLEEITLECVQHISTLDDSLAEFEEERLSILDQLKALEQKIITIGGDEEFIDDIKQIDQSSSYCAKDVSEDDGFSSSEVNGLDDKEVPIRKTMGSLAKRLLPLLDASDNEIKDQSTNEENVESDYSTLQNSTMWKLDAEMDGRNLSLEEEVDNVYERLQALEADREFLKHCMSSVNMGDKGMNILQEILQHLRDLRDAELRFKKMSGGMLE